MSEKADKLDQLFTIQESLQVRIRRKLVKKTTLGIFYPHFAEFPNMNVFDKGASYGDLPVPIRLGLNQGAIAGECNEVLEALGLLPKFGAKWWKEKIDYDHVKEELMDELHFLLVSFLTLGMTAQEVFDGYCEKMNVNQERQDNQY